MCGIIGYVGNKKFMPIAKQGLLNLEYRGYDSAGVAYFENDIVKIVKKQGNVSNLFDSIDENTDTFCGIGHTRWATHGVPSDSNSHPHQSENKYFTLVHNGVIENYNELKEEYLKNVNFKSGTDTEIIPNLMEKFYLETENILQAITETVKLLKGSFALAIIFQNQSDRIYFARNKSPLIIGIKSDENFISSDLIGIRDNVKEYAIIDDLRLGYITKNKVEIFDFYGKPRGIKIQSLSKSVFKSGKGKFLHYMIKEINEVPLAVKSTASYYKTKANALELIPKKYFLNVDKILIIACGTSYHSGLIGAKYFKQIAGIEAESLIASEFIYNTELLNSRTLCVFISQSGETADTLSAIKKAKKYGAKTLGITNVSTSSITTLCDYILPLNAGAEIAVASTKAYNCQLTVLLILANYLKDNCVINKNLINDIVKATSSVDIEKISGSVERLIDKINKASNIYMIGRDYDYVSCLEACLKLKEISYIPCEAYPAGELKHGTLALITKDVPVIAIITEEHLIEKTLAIASQVKARGGKVVVFTCFDLSCYDISDLIIIKLERYSEFLQPIFNIVAFQLLAYKTTLSLGYDPDRPRNLAKSVTVE